MAVMVLIISGAFAFVKPGYAWLWAILLSFPVVLLNIFTSGNYGSLLVLLFSFGGAYLAYAIKKLN
jgi:hypothetical protein